MVKARRRISVNRLLDELLGLARLGGRARNAQFDGRVAVDRGGLELQSDRELPTGARRCDHLDRFAGPLASAARDERALQSGLARRVEEIHERRTEQRVRARMAEQVRPCLVRVDEDAFLNMRDRVDGARHERLELLLVLVGGEQRLVERPLEPERAQLALGHAAQALGLAERHEVLRAGEKGLGDVGFLRRAADDDERHGARCFLLDLGDLADRRWQAIGEEAQQLRRMVVDRARERVDLRDPMAMHGMAAIAQRSVDELDVVFATAEHDERYLGLRHALIVRGRRAQCKQRVARLAGRRSQTQQGFPGEHGFT